VTELANIPNPFQPLHRSPWSQMVIETMRAEYPERLSQEQQLRLMTELAQRLGALREWERYDRNHLPSVTLKHRYKEVAKIKGPADGVMSVHVDLAGRIVSGGQDYSVRISAPGALWRWRTQELQGHSDLVMAVQGLSDGRVASASKDSTVRLWAPTDAGGWDVQSTVRFSSDRFSCSVACFQVLPDGAIITGHYNGDLIRSHFSSEGEWEQKTISSTVRLWALQAVPDNRVVTACEDGTVRVWTNDWFDEWSEGVVQVSEEALFALHVLPNGRIIVGGDDGYVRELTPNGDGDFVSSVVGRHQEPVQCLQALPDGRIVSGGSDDTLRIWTRQLSGEWQYEILKGHRNCVQSVQILPDGKIVSASQDGTIRIWDGEVAAAL